MAPVRGREVKTGRGFGHSLSNAPVAFSKCRSTAAGITYRRCGQVDFYEKSLKFNYSINKKDNSFLKNLIYAKYYFEYNIWAQ